MIAINANRRIVDDPAQVRRGRHRGREALDHSPCSVPRWNGDDDRLRLLERPLQPRIGVLAVERISVNALGPQRGDALAESRRSARVDPGFTGNEPAGGISEAEEEHPHRRLP